MAKQQKKTKEKDRKIYRSFLARFTLRNYIPYTFTCNDRPFLLLFLYFGQDLRTVLELSKAIRGRYKNVAVMHF